MLNYFLYSILLLYIHQQYTNKNMYVTYTTVILLIVSFFKHLYKYPERITENNGWTNIIFIKQFFLYTALILILTNSHLLNNKYILIIRY